jgi:hypothetical protein
LITELAVYEKEPDAVKATPELVSRFAEFSSSGYTETRERERVWTGRGGKRGHKRDSERGEE